MANGLYLSTFSEFCEHHAELGGKGRSLFSLKKAGFNVPAFHIIPSSQCARWLDEATQGQLNVWMKNWIEGRILANEFSDQVNKALSCWQPAPSFVQGIVQKIQKNGWASFSVRSSAEDEDGAENSFAGIMETCLRQSTADDLVQSIRRVLLSAFSKRALDYRIQRRVKGEQIRCAIIVQEMIDASAAGVVLTVDPATGSKTTMVLSAGRGTGDKVVDGTADCDEWQLDFSTGSLKKRGSRSQSLIPQDFIREIFETSLSVADFYRAPQDIEWALKNDEVFILQSRPITQENARRNMEYSKLVLDNSNIQESFCGITLPLSFSFVSKAYHSVYSQVMSIMGFSPEAVARHDNRHRNMLSYVNGRVYYNIRSWYDGLLFLPSFGRNKEDMERMMGVEHPVDFVQSQILSRNDKLKKLPFMVLLLVRLLGKFARIHSLVRGFQKSFEEEYKKVPRQSLYRLTDLEILALAEATRERFLENWDVPIINDFYVMMANGKVVRALKAVGLGAEYPHLLRGETLASTEPTEKLLEMADIAKQDRELSEKILNGTSNVRQWAEISRPGFEAMVDAYIERFGDRVMGELKLETRSLREDEGFLWECLKSYIQQPQLSLHAYKEKELASRRSSEERVFPAIRAQKGPLRLLFFKKNLADLRQAIANREEMRLARTRVFGLFRSFYGELASRWAARGWIETREDFFYLKEEEIWEYLESRSFHGDLKPLIAVRKIEFNQWKKQEPPGHFTSEIPIYQSQWAVPGRANEVAGQVLEGLGCYPGKIQGQAVKVSVPEDAKNLLGKILVATRTDPGWTPLFPQVRALLVERGSSLSHSAIVARELGLPTIVNIPGLMDRIQTGDLLEMDGATGMIRILEPWRRDAGV